MKTALAGLLAAFLGILYAVPSPRQRTPRDVAERIERAVAPAFEAAITGFPCKIGTRGKPKMLQWEEVDECLNSKVAAKVDWQALSEQLRQLRDSTRDISALEFSAAVETVLGKYTLPFEKMFVVKDEKTLLPLTNSVLKFLPPDSLQETPVYDKVGTLMGTFAGVYIYESSGSGAKYRLSLFQYLDRNGEFKPVPEKLLLDSFGIPWKDARSHPGFRLSAEKLQIK